MTVIYLGGSSCGEKGHLLVKEKIMVTQKWI